MAFNTPPTSADLANAGTDIENLALVVQGPSDHDGDGSVTMRNGSKVKTLALIVETADAASGEIETRLVQITAKEALVTLIAQELAPDGAVTRVSDELNSVIVAAGVDPAKLDHDTETGTVVTDPRTIVTREEVRDAVTVTVWYRPRTLPYTIEAVFDAADYYEVPGATGFNALESQFETFLQRLQRLEGFHPASAPVIAPIPPVSLEDGDTGLLIDFATFVTDADTPAGNLSYSLTNLPAGFTFTGSELSADAPGITAQTVVTLTVTDELGNSDARNFNLEVYAVGATPIYPPTLGALPDLSITAGEPIPIRDLQNDVVDADNTAEEQTFSVTVDELSGLTVSADGELGGNARLPGTYAVTVKVTDPDLQEDTSVFSFTVLQAPPPQWAPIYPQNTTKGAAAYVMDVGEFLSDEFTPNSEMAEDVVWEDLPAGTSTNGLVLTLPTSTAGVFTIGAIARNRAGEQRRKTFQYVVNEFPVGPPSGLPGGYQFY